LTNKPVKLNKKEQAMPSEEDPSFNFTFNEVTAPEIRPVEEFPSARSKAAHQQNVYE
jgi:hypothetical protein